MSSRATRLWAAALMAVLAGCRATEGWLAGPPIPNTLGEKQGLSRSAERAGFRGSVDRTVAGAAGVDCGPRALALVLKAMGREADLGLLRKVAGTNRFGTTLAGLERAAGAAGARAEAVQMDMAALRRFDGPGVAWVDGDHYVAVLGVDGDSARIHDPNLAAEETIPTESLLRRGGGIVMRVSP